MPVHAQKLVASTLLWFVSSGKRVRRKWEWFMFLLPLFQCCCPSSDTRPWEQEESPCSSPERGEVLLACPSSSEARGWTWAPVTCDALTTASPGKRGLSAKLLHFLAVLDLSCSLLAVCGLPPAPSRPGCSWVSIQHPASSTSCLRPASSTFPSSCRRDRQQFSKDRHWKWSGLLNSTSLQQSRKSSAKTEGGMVLGAEGWWWERSTSKFPADFFFFFNALNIAEASCMPGWLGLPQKETFSF